MDGCPRGQMRYCSFLFELRAVAMFFRRVSDFNFNRTSALDFSCVINVLRCWRLVVDSRVYYSRLQMPLVASPCLSTISSALKRLPTWSDLKRHTSSHQVYRVR